MISLEYYSGTGFFTKIWAIWVIVSSHCKLFLWKGLVAVFHTVKASYWLLSGTHHLLHRNMTNKDNYKTSAQVQHILWRYTLAPVSGSSTPQNFIAVHTEFRDPSTILCKDITLYSVTPTQATFVEADHDLTECSRYPFLKVAQFHRAKRVITLPIYSFHRLATHIGRPQAKVILVPNTMRCGSTLLCQIFESTGKCKCLAEPDVLRSLFLLRDRLPANEFRKLAGSSLNLLCKPDARNPAAYIIKIAGPFMELVPALCDAYPEAISLFMYRAALAVAKSGVRMHLEDPLLRLKWVTLCLLSRQQKRWLGLLKTMAGAQVPEGIEIYASEHLLVRYIMHWSALCWMYRNMRASGINMSAVKYEDLVVNPWEVTAKIFTHCGLGTELVGAGLRAMKEDSQRNCAFSRVRLSQWTAAKVTPQVAEQMDVICDHFALPRVQRECILEGTITTLQNSPSFI